MAAKEKRDWTSKEKNHIRPNILKILHEQDNKIISNNVQQKNRERPDHAANTEKKKKSELQMPCNSGEVKIVWPTSSIAKSGSVGQGISCVWRVDEVPPYLRILGLWFRWFSHAHAYGEWSLHILPTLWGGAILWWAPQNHHTCVSSWYSPNRDWKIQTTFLD